MGFGNLLDDIIFSEIPKNKPINQLKKFFKNKNYTFNHLMVNNKAPFFGPSVEWHQEIYNLKTYGSGHNQKIGKIFFKFI